MEVIHTKLISYLSVNYLTCKKNSKNLKNKKVTYFVNHLYKVHKKNSRARRVTATPWRVEDKNVGNENVINSKNLKNLK